MITKIIEACHVDLNGKQTGNYGKFMVGRFNREEWEQRSQIAGAEHQSVIAARGWSSDHLLVLDLQTGEGAIFRAGGLARADLDKRKIWVCPLFLPFLTWLYQQPLENLDLLPPLVTFKVGAVEFAMHGYRRKGE